MQIFEFLMSFQTVQTLQFLFKVSLALCRIQSSASVIGERALSCFVCLTVGLHPARLLVIAACVAFTPLLFPPVSLQSGDSTNTSSGRYHEDAPTSNFVLSHE
jgi:hypothetical protein